MPPIRLTFLFLGFIAFSTLLTFLSLVRTHTPGNAATESSDSSKSKAFRSFFSFRSPSSLFPPSAIISLTDDNSTFFLARPADFGPSLVEDGLSGQLWVGSGFGDETAGRGGAASEAEGELGCSDVPGWHDSKRSSRSGDLHQNSNQGSETSGTNVKSHIADAQSQSQVEDDASSAKRDGTDDHLNPIPSSVSSVPAGKSQTTETGTEVPPAHSDIQSLQESAEISSKIVLLSRGGCGFLDKVKWAQRRGAVAVVVGDNTRGGSLVTMYAKGDTSNVSIPSLFTSRTTAHLLSSLIPLEEPHDRKDDKGKKYVNGKSPKARKLQARAQELLNMDQGEYQAAENTRITPKHRSGQKKDSASCETNTIFTWRSLLGLSTPLTSHDDSRRPPSSGRLHWTKEQWDDDTAERTIKKSIATDVDTIKSYKKGILSSPKDGFEIGVQDWRDPDLISTSSKSFMTMTSTTLVAASSAPQLRADHGKETSSEGRHRKEYSGGSITPGSGQYDNAGSPGRPAQGQIVPSHSVAGASDRVPSTAGDGLCPDMSMDGLSRRWWFQKLFRSPLQHDIKHIEREPRLRTQLRRRDPDPTNSEHDSHPKGNLPTSDSINHDGLWITLTPTTISTTPFFDTVLVLVVSPLVTLTVVYAMLLLRSRIRRRRWRAPKSVVDRLPVRTYQTMSPSSASSSSIHTSPRGSSPSSPLLQHTSLNISSRSTARSRANSGIQATHPASDLRGAQTMDKTQQQKPQQHVKSRTKYHSKQVECVVCLEEYEEGRSKVMSLPCGHEFHADCM